MAETIKYLVTFDAETGTVQKAEQLGSAGDLASVPAAAFSVDVAKLAGPLPSARPSHSRGLKGPRGPNNPTPTLGLKGPNNPTPTLGLKGPKGPNPPGLEAPHASMLPRLPGQVLSAGSRPAPPKAPDAKAPPAPH